MTANEKTLLAKLAKLEAKIRDLEHGFRGAGRSGKRMGDALTKALDPRNLSNFVVGLVGAGSAVTAMHSAWKLVSAEIRNSINLQKEAAGAQVTVSSARQDVVRNMAGRSKKEITDTLAQGAKIASRTSVDEKYIQQASASAISASGGNIPAAMAAVEQAAKFLGDQPQAIAGFAGSLLDLSKVTGTIDARVNQGYLSLVGAQSRVVDPRQQAQNIPRSIIGQMAFGATHQEAAALFAALTTGSGDITGATSGTAAISLTEQLEKFIPAAGRAAVVSGGLTEIEKIEKEKIQAQAERAKERHDNGLKLSDKDLSVWDKYNRLLEKEKDIKTLPAIAPGAKTTGARIKMLQANPELAKEFFSQASFEKVALGPIRQLLTDKNSEVSKLFAANMGAMKDKAGLAALADESLANKAADPLFQNAKLQRSFKNAGSMLLTSTPGRGQAGIVREGIKDLLIKSGQTELATKIDGAIFEGRSGFGAKGAIDAAIPIIQSRINELGSPQTQYPVSFAGAGAVSGVGNLTRTPTAEESAQAEILRSILQTLKEMQTTNQETARKAPNNRTLGKPDEDR